MRTARPEQSERERRPPPKATLTSAQPNNAIFWLGSRVRHGLLWEKSTFGRGGVPSVSDARGGGVMRRVLDRYQTRLDENPNAAPS